MPKLTAAASVFAAQLEINLPDLGIMNHADLLIIDGDPLKKIGLLQNKSRILKVIKGGKIEVDSEKSCL